MTVGVRVDSSEYYRLSPGEYGRDQDGEWSCCPPRTGSWPFAGGRFFGKLTNHEVVEHEDGTITVSPSILISHRTWNEEKQDYDEESWHGYLEHGEWREV